MRDPFVTAEEMVVIARGVGKLPIFSGTDFEPPAADRVRELARLVNTSRDQNGGVVALGEFLLSLARQPILRYGNEYFAKWILQILCDRLDLVINLGHDHDPPEWLDRVLSDPVDLVTIQGEIDRNLMGGGDQQESGPGIQGSGIVADVACAFTNVSADVASLNRVTAEMVVDTLKRYGVDAHDPVDHRCDHRADAHCDVGADLDLLVVVGAGGGDRVGFQVTRAAALLARVLLLVPAGAATSCLYRSTHVGEVTPKTYTFPREIPGLIAEYLREDETQLRLHARHRVERDNRLSDDYSRLRDAVMSRAEHHWPNHWLIGKRRALQIVASREAYACESADVLSTLGDYVGLDRAASSASPSAPEAEVAASSLVGTRDLLLRTLTREQQRDFAAMTRIDRASIPEQVEVLKMALTTASAVASGKMLRSKSYRNVDEWRRALSLVRRPGRLA